MRTTGLARASTAALLLGVSGAALADGFALALDNTLLRFRGDPAAATEVGPISGFTGSDTGLVGIDHRPADRQLYALGNAGGIYRLDRRTAVLTPVNTLSTALSGANFGIDFNPTVDRLRIIGDAGQNLRHNLAGTTTTDGGLNYTGTLTAGATAAGMAAAGYTNNDAAAATGTTLFTIDASLDQLNIQVPPNTGVQTAVGSLTVDVSLPVGFDIFTKRSGGQTVAHLGFITSGTALFSVDLLTGRATPVGNFTKPVRDISYEIAP